MMETLQPQSLHAPELLSSNLNSITTRNINGDKVVIPNVITSESNWNPLVMDNSGEKEATSDIIVELDPQSSNSPVDQTLSEVVRETLSSLGGSGTLDQIAKHIISNYPHKTTHKRWRTTIAGILSTHFSKKDNEGLYQKQSIWSIEPSQSSVKRSTRSGRGTNPRRSNSSSNLLPIVASSSSEPKRRISSRSSSKSSLSMELDDTEGTTSTPTSASDIVEDEEDQENSSDSKEMETEEQVTVQPVVVPTPVPIPIPVISIKKAPEIKDYVGMNLSYHQRVVMSLKALGGEGATYAQICEYFAIHFAKLIEEKKNWKQAIASELSHKFGRKIDKQQGVTLWTLDKDIQEKKPKLKPRKKRKAYTSNGSTNTSENSRSRQSNIKKSVSTEYYSDDSQEDDDVREMEVYRPSSSASTRSRRSNDNLDNFGENSYSDLRTSLSDEEYTKRKRPKRTSSFNMITHSNSTSLVPLPTKRFSPSASDSEKEESLGDSKKIELSKWKKYVEEAITKLQNRAQLHEILEYIEMSYADVVAKKRLWKNLVALCLKSYFRPEPNQYWTINDGSKSKFVEIPSNWPSTVNYQSYGLDWSDESLREDREFFSLEFSYSFMRSKPRKKYVSGDIRVIDYTHPAYKKGVSEFGYFVSEDALPGDYLGEYGGQVQIRKKNLSNESSYLAALWDMEPDNTESNSTEDRLQIDIDASKNGNELRFLNSCQNVKDIRGNLQTSNAALIRMYDSVTRLPCLGLFATKYIPANFEVLLDYSVQDNQPNTNENSNSTTNTNNRVYLNQIMPSKVCYKKFDQISDDEDTDQDEG